MGVMMFDMVTKMRLNLLAIAIATLSANVWAALAEPAASWSGAALATGTVKNGYTISYGDGASFADNIITLTESSSTAYQGVKIALPEGFAGEALTVTVKYTDYSNPSANRALFSFTENDTEEINGYANGNTLKSSSVRYPGVNYTEKKQASFAIPTAGMMYFSLDKASQGLKYGFATGDETNGYNAPDQVISEPQLKAAAFKEIHIGGCYAKIGWYYRIGLKISEIKVYACTYDDLVKGSMPEYYQVFAENFAGRIVTWATTAASASTDVNMGVAQASFTSYNAMIGANVGSPYAGNGTNYARHPGGSTTSALGWTDFCNHQNITRGYTSPGLVLRFPSYVEGTSIVLPASFGPLNLGGLMVEAGASSGSQVPTFKWDNTNRETQLGDTRTNGSVPTFFVLKDSIKLDRGAATTFCGDLTVDVADGKMFEITSGAIALAEGTSLRLKGAGKIKYNQRSNNSAAIDASSRTLDFSGKTSASTEAFFDGPLTVSDTTTFAFPAGLAAGEAFKLCTGTLTAPTELVEANVHIGNDPLPVTLSFNATEKTVSYQPTAVASVTVDGVETTYLTIADAIAAADGAARTIKLLMAVDEDVDLPSTITINMNGKALNGVITGSGVIVYADNALPSASECAEFMKNTWTGTVAIVNKTDDQKIDLPQYGNVGSTVRLNGVTGWFPNSTDPYQPTVELVNPDNGVAASFSGFSASFHYKFRKLKGTGTFAYTGTNIATGGNNHNGAYTFNDVSEFTGSLTTTETGAGFWLGTGDDTAHGDDMKGKIVVSSGTAYTLPSSATWTAPAGIMVAGTLTTSDSLKLNGKAYGVAAGGMLEFSPTSTANLWNGDLSGITGEGAIKFSGTSWIALPSGDGKMFAPTLEVINNSTGNGGGLLLNKAATYVIGPMSGNGEIRFDADDGGARTLKIIQSKDTVWTGNVKSQGSTARELNIQITSTTGSTFKRTGQCADAKTYFTVDEGATLQLEHQNDGNGNIVVLNGGKLKTTGHVDAHGRIVRELRLTANSTFESTSNIFGIGHNNNTSKLSLNNNTLTVIAPQNGTRFYLDKVTVETAGTLNVEKGKLFLHCGSIDSADSKIVIGANASIEADGQTLRIGELEYNGTATSTAGDMCMLTVTKKLSGTGSIPKVTLGDGVQVRGQVTVTAQAVLSGVIELMESDTTLVVPAAIADWQTKVLSGIAEKGVAYDTETRTFSIVDELPNIASVDGENYTSLAAALRAIEGSEESKTITLLMPTVESVTIPANVTVTATPTCKILGTISGEGTYSIALAAANSSSGIQAWFTDGQLADFSGTVLMTQGRFEFNTAQVSLIPDAVTLATRNQGKIYLGSGTWNNRFVLAGNGWTGDGSYKMGPVALRVDNATFGSDASIEVVVENEVVPAFGVHNTSPTFCAISGEGGVRLRAHTEQTITIPAANLSELSGMITLVDANVTLAIHADAEISVTVANNISGAGKVTKTGTGTLELSGTVEPNGGTTVVAGRLNLTGTIRGGMTVNGTLTGSGTVQGNITFANGAEIELPDTNTIIHCEDVVIFNDSIKLHIPHVADDIKIIGAEEMQLNNEHGMTFDVHAEDESGETSYTHFTMHYSDGYVRVSEGVDASLDGIGYHSLEEALAAANAMGVDPTHIVINDASIDTLPAEYRNAFAIATVDGKKKIVKADGVIVVMLDANGGLFEGSDKTGNSPHLAKYLQAGDDYPAEIPVRKDFEFAGWFMFDHDENEHPIAADAKVSADCKLHAHWTGADEYKITHLGTDPVSEDLLSRPPLAIPHDWMTTHAKGIDESERGNWLNGVGENGLNRWQSYVLGLDPSSAKSLPYIAVDRDGDDKHGVRGELCIKVKGINEHTLDHAVVPMYHVEYATRVDESGKLVSKTVDEEGRTSDSSLKLPAPQVSDHHVRYYSLGVSYQFLRSKEDAAAAGVLYAKHQASQPCREHLDHDYIPTALTNGDFMRNPNRDPRPAVGSMPDYMGVDNPDWNTTEPDNGKNNEFCFEWRTDMNTFNPNLTAVQGSDPFVEMNAQMPAMLYQDLTTHGGDVIEWRLKHAARTQGGAPLVQTMRVEIGKPMANDDGQVIAATGTGADITPNIVKDASLAIFEAFADKSYSVKNGFDDTSTIAYGNKTTTRNLYLNRDHQNKRWYTAGGVYVVPKDQAVTRFGFISANPEAASLGNLLDNIEFFTLLGNLVAKEADDGSVLLTGYWGDTDPMNKLVVQVGGIAHAVDMMNARKDGNGYFEVTIPPELIGSAGSLTAYHEDYPETAVSLDLLPVSRPVFDTPVFGMLRVDSTARETIINVPWMEASDGVTHIQVCDLVRASNLTEGDELLYYTGSTGSEGEAHTFGYKAWKLAVQDGVKYWAPYTVVSKAADGETHIDVSAPDGKEKAVRGGALFVRRTGDLNEPIYVHGRLTMAEAATTTVAQGSFASPVYTLLAPSGVDGVDLNAKDLITNANTITQDDMIITGVGQPLVYKDGQWGVMKTVNFRPTFDTTPAKVKVGHGIWYVSRGGSPTFNW